MAVYTPLDFHVAIIGPGNCFQNLFSGRSCVQCFVFTIYLKFYNACLTICGMLCWNTFSIEFFCDAMVFLCNLQHNSALHANVCLNTIDWMHIRSFLIRLNVIILYRYLVLQISLHYNVWTQLVVKINASALPKVASHRLWTHVNRPLAGVQWLRDKQSLAVTCSRTALLNKHSNGRVPNL